MPVRQIGLEEFLIYYSIKMEAYGPPSAWNGIYKISGEIITKNFNKENSNLPGNLTINLAFAQDGSLWSAHGGFGIARVVNDEVEDMTEILKIPPNTNVRDLAFDKSGTLWLGTNRGVGRYKNDIHFPFLVKRTA